MVSACMIKRKASSSCSCCMRIFLMTDEHRPKHVANNNVHKCMKVSYNPVVYRDGFC